MRFVILFALAGFLVHWPGIPTLAEDLFVNNVVGDDRNNGRARVDPTSNAGPFRTISRALRMARRGDRIFVEKTAEAYHECLSVQGTRNSGTDYLPFQIVSNGAVLDGTRPARGWEHYRGSVFRLSPELKHHQQLYLDDKPAERVVSRFGSLVPDLQPRQWTVVDGWIYFCTDAGFIPGQYNLRYCAHQTGITLYEVENVVIDGLVVQGFQLDGINAHDSVTRCAIRNCQLRGNGRAGLSVGGASRVSLENALAGANGAAQVRSEGYCKLNIDGCRLLESETSGPAIVKTGGSILVDGQVMDDFSRSFFQNAALPAVHKSSRRGRGG